MSTGSPRTAPKMLGVFAAGLMVATALTATVTVLPTTPVHAQQQLQSAAPIDPSRGVADLVEKVMPAVVSVEVKFANVASNGNGQRMMPNIPGLPEGSPFEDFFRQFRQGQPEQRRAATAWLKGRVSSSRPTATWSPTTTSSRTPRR